VTRHTRYTWRKERESFPVATTMWSRLACCDCGLVHCVTARVTRTGRVYLRAFRDEAETTHVRRRFRRKLTHREAP
jgi:hypothetical protein